MTEYPYLKKSHTKGDWIRILQDKEITRDINILILKIMYAQDEYQISSGQIGLHLGSKDKNTASNVNREISGWGDRIQQKLPLELSIRKNGKSRRWDIFFEGHKDRKFFIWKIRNELVEALDELNLTGEIKFPDEIPIKDISKIFEGAQKTIIVNSYERSAKARELCIMYYGSTCCVCSFDFEKIYGELGKDYIHVHHIVKISDIGKEYEVDPKNDLRPVCPNCHAMLHKNGATPLSIEELKAIIQNLKK